MGAITLNSRPQLLHVFGNTTTSPAALVNAAGGAAPAVPAGQRAGIFRVLITLSVAGSITIQDTTGAALSQTFNLAANGSVVLDMPDNGDPWWQSAQGLGLQIAFTGASANLGWDVYWYPTV